MKKYILFLLVLVFAIGAVSASDSFDDLVNELDSVTTFEVEYFPNDTNVTVGNYNFTIPQGFGQIDHLSSDLSENNQSQNVRFFTDSNNNIIVISISIGGEINDTIHSYISNSTGYENVTIEGHDGMKCVEDAFAFFTYAENNDIVVLQAPNDSYFERMIA